ncbi:MAG: extracellular solute-binding protein [Bacteroidetes bacterium]|nr:extracellular solute-binding protein [Bacteroidota bacterium]
MAFKFKQEWAIISLAIVTVIYLGIYFFGSKLTDQTIKEIHFADRMTPAHLKLIENYNKLHEGRVKVIPVDFPNFDFSTNERKELLARSMRAKEDGIDVYAVDIIWVQRFAKWSEPLGQYFTEEERKRILPQAIYSCFFEGELVSIPFNRVASVMYYREDLIRKMKNGDQLILDLDAGISWEKFISYHQSSSISNPWYIFPAANYEGLICVFTELLLSLKPDYFDVYGFNFRTPEAQKALQLMVDLVKKYKTTPEIVTEFSEIPSFDYFVKHDALFIWGWPTYGKDFVDTPIDTSIVNRTKWVNVPHFEGGNPASVLGGWNLMVSRFSEHKQETADFIKYLISDEAQALIHEKAGYFPVVKSFYDDSLYLGRYPELRQYKKLISSGVNRPAHTEYTRFSEIITTHLVEAIRMEISVKEALDRASVAIGSDSQSSTTGN